MDISKNDFYYFSVDLSLPGLPTKCKFIKRLENAEGREAALIMCENNVEGLGKYLVVVPRSNTDYILDNSTVEEVVFLYTFDDSSVVENKVNLKQAKNIDIGAVVTDQEQLKKWC